MPRILGLVVMVLLASCSGDEQAREPGNSQTGPLTVFTVHYPLRYFAERIGGDHVRVEFPAPRDVDPAYWKPEREVVLRFQRADLILLNGAGYARWTEMTSLPAARTIDTSRPYHDRYIEIEDRVVHAHGPGGEHAHGGTAFTTWLDPLLAIDQARVVLRAFSNLRPEREAEFKAGFADLERDLRELDAALTAAAAQAPDRALLASHPVYQYLARRYSLNVESVHWEAGEVPSPEEWQELTMLRARHPASWMLWEGAPHPATRARLEQAGIRSVVYDPCANVPQEGDFLTVMQANVRALATALTP